MDKKDKIHAEDLLEKLQKHVGTPEIPEEKKPESVDEQDSQEKHEKKRPITLEELFGHTFIDRKSSRAAQKSLVKTSPKKIKRPEKKDDGSDKTKAKIDETEYNLMAIFGMDQEGEADPAALEAAQQTEETASEPDAYDHLTADEKNKIALGYRRGLRTRALRLFGLIALGVLTFFWELAGLVGANLPAFFNHAIHPVTTGWIAIQLMVFAALLVNGTFGVFKNKHQNWRSTPELIFIALLAFHTLYLLVRIFFFANYTMTTYCLPVMLAAVFCQLYDYYEWKREYRSFRIAFSSKFKYTLHEAKDDSAKSEREALADCMPADTRYFMVDQIKNVESFHKLFHAQGPVKRPIKLILPAALLIAACFGAFIYATTKQVESALTAAMGVLGMTLPISLLYTFYAPMASLSDMAYNHHSAVVGEGAMEEYTPPAAIVFTDAELFAPEDIHLVGVKVYENGDLSKVLGYASAIFCETGGALGEMFASIVEVTGYTADMDFITVDDDGVRAAVNGELVFVGNHDFMKNEGIVIPHDSRNFDTDNCIMYLAIGRKLSAKMEIAYTLDPVFEGIAKNIFRSGMCVAIKTFDPNISRSMLESHIRWGGDMPLKIVRGKDKNDRIALRESAAGWIVSSTRGGLFETIKLCSTTRHLMQTGVVLAALSLLVSIPVLWLIMKFGSVEHINALTVAIYQAIWLLPSISITKLFG